MSLTLSPTTETATVADLLRQLGGIPPDRIRWNPTPGTATKKDLLRGLRSRPCELVDATLVDKPMGFLESRLAILIATEIELFLRGKDIGFVVGESGLIQVLPNQIRMPDCSFYLWSRFPNREAIRVTIMDLTPDWAIEVLSPSNSRREMARKRQEYFAGGATLVWEIHPTREQITAYTNPVRGTIYQEADTLTAAPVLPGFRLTIRKLFAQLEGRGSGK